MKVIDLLNKIANGEEVTKFKYYGGIYIYDKETRVYRFQDMWFDFDIDNLNDEVEIIEEDKKTLLRINKIIPSQNYAISDSKNHSIDERFEMIRKRLYADELYMLDIANSLNELIDEVNKLKENK